VTESINTKFFLPKGVSQINVSPTSRTVLPAHIIISDLSNKPEANLKHNKWAPEQDIITDTSLTEINTAIFALSKEKASYPTRNDVCLHQALPPSGPGSSVALLSSRSLSLLPPPATATTSTCG
jgi:hypothetical protein